jgi:hypothetical protein
MLTTAQILRLALGVGIPKRASCIGVRPAVSEPRNNVCRSDSARQGMQLVEEGSSRAGIQHLVLAVH